MAEKELGTSEKPSTDSHISLLTGIHRKDIKRLRQNIHADMEIIPQSVSLGARLVSLWSSDARYLDENKQPKPLPRFIKDGGEISFEGLVTRVSSDIRSRVVLDEWLRLGVVHFDEHQNVCLNTAAFIPVHGFEEKAFYFGHNLHDHAAAATHNLIAINQPFFERSVYYDNLSADSVKMLAEKCSHIGMDTLLSVNKEAFELEKKDEKINKLRHRMTFGVYFYSEPLQQKEPAEDTKKDIG